MHVCICIYARMCECMYVLMCVCIRALMNECMNVRMHAIYLCVHVYVFVGMLGCMLCHVCAAMICNGVVNDKVKNII